MAALAPELQDACRVDVWLWRARFFKTRSLAARVIGQGGVRVTRAGQRVAIDKPSRTLHLADVVVFPRGEGWLAVRVAAFGWRRGPSSEARELYEEVEAA
jgi:ribosome-associated heat shock protein Hsp15